MASSSKGKEPIEDLCNDLSLHDINDVVIPIDVEDFPTQIDEGTHALVGTLLTEKTIKFSVMRDTMGTVWRPGKGMMVKEIQTNLYLFIFFHEKDMNRILEDGPWSFEQNLLILHKLESHESPFEVDLSKCEFWIQIHKIPKQLTTLKMAEILGNSLGEFVKADISNFDGNVFIRIRVRIDITKPLRKRVTIIW